MNYKSKLQSLMELVVIKVLPNQYKTVPILVRWFYLCNTIWSMFTHVFQSNMNWKLLSGCFYIYHVLFHFY